MVVGGLVALLVIAGIVWGAWALVDDDSAAPETGVTLEQIVDEPRQYLGQQVTLSAELEERYDRAFSIGGDALGEELLILPPADYRLPSFDGDPPVLQVTGTVTMVDSKYETLLGDAFEEHEDEPAIVATTVSTYAP